MAILLPGFGDTVMIDRLEMQKAAVATQVWSDEDGH